MEIQRSYEDAAGKRRMASPDAIRAILRHRVPAKKPVVEPVNVVWGKRKPVVRTRLAGTVEYEVAGVLDRAKVVDGAITLPEALPIGYHNIRVNGYEAMIFAAPPRAPQPDGKTWGIFAPVYEMGDLGDLERYREWVESLGGSVVATLPILAPMPGERSPYSPSSRLFWNAQYLDVSKPFVPDAEFDAFAKKARPFAEFMSNVATGFSPSHDGLKPVTTSDVVIAQYRLHQQMRRFKRLYLDFPLGVHPNGFDAHHYSDHFAKGVSVGAPPDLFFTKGQNWSFPPLDPDAIRERHHDYFRACVRHHMEHAAILRIDHVMGLHRLYWIPEGAEAKDGVYVRYPAEELYAILLIEAARTNTVIVGEDLGTVPAYVPQAMKRHGLRRMFVVQYDPSARTPPRESVASVNTHDMPTFAGFWGGKDIDDRVEQDLLDENGAADERRKREQIRQSLTRFLTARGLLSEPVGNTFAVLKALLGFLSESDAEVVLVNLEDLWLETEPQNVPGVPERSWRKKFRYSLEELKRHPRVLEVLRDVNDRRRKSDGE